MAPFSRCEEFRRKRRTRPSKASTLPARSGLRPISKTKTTIAKVGNKRRRVGDDEAEDETEHKKEEEEEIYDTIHVTPLPDVSAKRTTEAAEHRDASAENGNGNARGSRNASESRSSNKSRGGSLSTNSSEIGDDCDTRIGCGIRNQIKSQVRNGTSNSKERKPIAVGSDLQLSLLKPPPGDGGYAPFSDTINPELGNPHKDSHRWDSQMPRASESVVSSNNDKFSDAADSEPENMQRDWHQPGSRTPGRVGSVVRGTSTASITSPDLSIDISDRISSPSLLEFSPPPPPQQHISRRPLALESPFPSGPARWSYTPHIPQKDEPTFSRTSVSHSRFVKPKITPLTLNPPVGRVKPTVPRCRRRRPEGVHGRNGWLRSS